VLASQTDPDMPVTTEQQLSPNARQLYQKARQASDIGNHGYVIQLMQSVLKEQPNFLEGRKLVRAAALSQAKGKKGGFSLAGTTLGLTAAGTLKKDPLAAIELAEKQLATDPTNAQANQLLYDAAMRAGMPETAGFALETLVGSNPKDTKLMHQLANHYLSIGDNDKAVYTRIAQVNPSDLEAIKKSKDASAQATMKKGKWEEVAQSGGSMSFRDLIKSKDEAIALENKSKVVRTSEQISQQVAEAYAQWEPQQSNMDLSRRLANLYEQWFEVAVATNLPPEEAEGYLDNSIWFYGHTNGLLNGGDPNIARKYTDLQAKKVERRIKVLEDWLATVEDRDHPEVVPYVEELQQLIRNRDSAVIDIAKKRVADNPTDLLLRYELGEALMKAGQASDAIPELQRAQQNPNVRLKAMNLLGQCFVDKGMLDLAVSRFKTAASELVAMDTTKKEVLYRLGLVYEKMGKQADYLNCMKEIYEADYGYLDVAKRVEASYTAS
jgi:tetratricopeptide (TPR) repeat protein